MSGAWYAVAYDVAGGIHAWRGPMSWSTARHQAAAWERNSLVRRALVCESPPGINRRFLFRNHG